MKNRKYLYLLALVPFILVAFMYEIIPLITVISNSRLGSILLRSKAGLFSVSAEAVAGVTV